MRKYVEFFVKSSEEFEKTLLNHITAVKKSYTGVIVLCIGSKKSILDAYGPYVGEFLYQKSELANVKFIGRVQNELNALNIVDILKEEDLENNLVISVDASLSLRYKAGGLKVSNEPIKPGSAFRKNLGAYGDVSITAFTMNLLKKKDCLNLEEVIALAKLTSNTLYNCLEKLNIELSSLKI